MCLFFVLSKSKYIVIPFLSGIMIGIKNLGKVNTVAMGALFVLTIILSFVIFGKGTQKSCTEHHFAKKSHTLAKIHSSSQLAVEAGREVWNTGYRL